MTNLQKILPTEKYLGKFVLENFVELNAVLCVLALVVFAVNRHLKRHYGVFDRLGIPGPKPSLLCGNLAEILRKGQFQAIMEWRSQYGRVFGYFEGYTPVLSVSDPEIVKQVLVKDFQNFSHRKQFPLAPRKSLGLFLENGSQWKRSRSLLTPVFSSGKLKQMYSTMSDRVDHLMDNLENKKEVSIDMYDLFQCLTLDVIGRCAFGLQTNAQIDSNDPFLINIRTLFSYISKTFILPLVSNNATDLVHQMLFVDKKGKKPMSEREIVAQSLTFLLAGYETTSAVLAFLTHLLARHPDVQTRLSDEILNKIGKEEITYDSLSYMPYFNMVFDEVCRLYPTASLIVTRKAARDCVYGNLKIPAGMNVQVDVWGLHHDTELWEDAKKFDPERFSSTNKDKIKPFSFIPFGAGPRSCIGARFAMLETKIAIVRVLQKYRFEQSPETKVN
ncbi:Cytochrome P450 3A19,Thromboxane-A synthase,Putative cytochrome P450 CYP13A5,Putative cytochrome P450 CYP13A7,Putative cytochrome P450 CYP13A4,Cytochrome P450 72A225 [Mytilus edulis]|uniref:Cytochrome P450 3A19,Thromboxane-A synthase,Putative cytochrome P450 CYP13A5,Putative cytochrome P450 CYP13A7,Putative cytochrome P450 CYP13A4,Cytochrome P450 72A225 n=1 Tax=Mytilus edulis TaxID=6550 RepID=A0A8S3V8Z1_MYTED|nr:Cytochrome P450 3A19,Thromboxane-A synthase,Putative cytochrome P450 CYP13A5,Putative cytochrome P450 CYP13A7,Putative cytochrome P450 CYP13A4,Cytochrome P450 72A225 [Mytilus edulis]